MEHIDINDPSKCSGCGLCSIICPHKAISMVENEEGFLYPVINDEKCINCGLCKKKCQILSNVKVKKYLDIPKCYGVYLKNTEILKKSTSGGAFYVFAKKIIDDKGVVVGAAFDENMQLHHIIADNEIELEKIMGSKYLYSELGNIFINIKEYLDKNKKVLFTGLPCQISALYSYLNKDYDNLFTIEVICHGTPNQALFNKYKEYLEKKNKARLVDYKFRSKNKIYWGTYAAEATFEKEGNFFKKKIFADFDKYYMNFLDGNNYRETCYECKYANIRRYADITLGDFWGVEKLKTNFLNKYGVSIVILNSGKSIEFFEKIKDSFKYIDVDYDFAVKNNGQLEHPHRRTKLRDTFYKNFNKEDFYENISMKGNKKKYLKLLVPGSLKMKIKRMIFNIKRKGE